MASGHVNRIYRPNTWLHRPMLQNVKKALANSEPSTHGTSRQLVRCSDISGVGSKPDSSPTASIRASLGLRLTFRSNPIRAAEWYQASDFNHYPPLTAPAVRPATI